MINFRRTTITTTTTTITIIVILLIIVIIIRENLREFEFFLIAAQNNAIRTNYVKAKIVKKQQNRKCMLCGNRDETIYHIIRKCSKLAHKEYKTRYN